MGRGDSRKLRIAVLYKRDARDPTAFSGIPASLARALEDMGVDVVTVSAQPPVELYRVARAGLALAELGRLRRRGVREGWDYARKVAELSDELAVLRTPAVRWRLRRLPTADAIVQIGSEFTPAWGPPLVTYEDMTVAQAARIPAWDTWQALRPVSVRRRRERQRRIYERARATCTVTPWAADSVIADYGVPASKVAVVGIGRNLSPRPVTRSWSRPRFLFVGMDWRRKGGDRVVWAFARLRERVPEAELDVVGGHPRIDQPGVTGRGPLGLDDATARQRLERLYEFATCFVMPSLHDPSGIAYLEAGAAGVPSIGTTVGGAPFVIGDGGRLVDPEDDDALLRAMLELADPDVARSLGALALARAEIFTWRAVAERLLRALALPGLDTDELAEFLA